MFVRLTFVKFSPETVQEAKRLFMQEIIPAVREQKGNINIRLLDPVDLSDDFISITEWKTKADADAYEASGLYKKLVGRVQEHLTKPAVLKTYNVAEVPVTAQ